MEAFLLATGVIFLAELGDKSQLIALAFATRFGALTVLVGITIATAAVDGVSVLVGAAVGGALPTEAISVVAGIAFLGFAVWTLRGDDPPEQQPSKVDSVRGSALLAVGTTFFLAELGDKTMLATVTLAADHGLVATWAGSTLGMVLADGLAIVVGLWLGRQLPARVVRYGAAAAFAIFGVLLVVSGLTG